MVWRSEACIGLQDWCKFLNFLFLSGDPRQWSCTKDVLPIPPSSPSESLETSTIEVGALDDSELVPCPLPWESPWLCESNVSDNLRHISENDSSEHTDPL